MARPAKKKGGEVEREHAQLARRREHGAQVERQRSQHPQRHHHAQRGQRRVERYPARRGAATEAGEGGQQRAAGAEAEQREAHRDVRQVMPGRVREDAVEGDLQHQHGQ